MDMIVPVIMAGGSGTRLWPLSRDSYPKQFLRLFGSSQHSLLQETLLRVADCKNFTPPIIVCNEIHYFHCLDQLQEIQVESAHIIIEPVSRNTAPAIASLAYYAQSLYGEQCTLLVLPADHILEKSDIFIETILAATRFINQSAPNQLATFGIVPRQPKTEYGYIKTGKQLSPGIFGIEQFVEKPPISQAEAYVQAGNHYWNSGIFLFRADSYLEELAQHASDIKHHVQLAYQNGKHFDQASYQTLRLDKPALTDCPSDSIDYAIMEKTAHAVLLPLNITWSDLGSWDAVFSAGTLDAHSNVTNGEVVYLNTENCLLSSDHALIATVGIQDQIVVSTKDAVLVAHKDYTQQIKQLVAELKASHSAIATTHAKVFRPWGFYETLTAGEYYQVKHIMVKPGASLSLQLHYHRAEHWVVVEGKADVVSGDRTLILEKNESTYIPKETKHRLSNTTGEPLHVIEVQCGSYLGEDDIVRFEDNYQRETV